MKRFACLLAVLLAGPVLGQEKANVVVPFETLGSRHMIVEVMVNGKGPFTLIFDTGAPITLVGPKLARDAKVATGGGFAALFGHFGQQKIASLELGGVKLDTVDAIVMEHPIVNAIGQATGKKIDGIVGFNVFGRYKTTIDYQAKTLTFAPSEFRPVNMFDVLMKAMMPSANDLERVPVIAPKGLLGIEVAKKAGDNAAGVDVIAARAGSPAAKAGLKAGDRLLTVDGRWTDAVNDFFEAGRTLRPGETVAIEIERAGKKQTLKTIVADGF